MRTHTCHPVKSNMEPIIQMKTSGTADSGGGDSMEDSTEFPIIEHDEFIDEITELIEKNRKVVLSQVEQLASKKQSFLSVGIQQIEQWEHELEELKDRINEMAWIREPLRFGPDFQLERTGSKFDSVTKDRDELLEIINDFFLRQETIIRLGKESLQPQERDASAHDLLDIGSEMDRSIATLTGNLESLSTQHGSLGGHDPELDEKSRLQILETWPLPSYALAMSLLGFGAFVISMGYFLINSDSVDWFFIFLPMACLAVSIYGTDIWRLHETEKFQYFRSLDGDLQERISPPRGLPALIVAWFEDLRTKQQHRSIPTIIKRMTNAQLEQNRWRFSIVLAVVLAFFIWMTYLTFSLEANNGVLESSGRFLFGTLALISFVLVLYVLNLISLVVAQYTVILEAEKAQELKKQESGDTELKDDAGNTEDPDHQIKEH